MSFLTLTVNPNAATSGTANLQGARAWVRPLLANGGIATGTSIISMGHFLNPAATSAQEFAELVTAVTGVQKTAAKALRKVSETFTFDTGTLTDMKIRGLHSGSAVTGGPKATAPGNSTAVVLYATYNTPVTGLYARVTTAGTTAVSGPAFTGVVEGDVVTSGTAVFTITTSVGIYTWNKDAKTTNVEMLIEFPSGLTGGQTEIEYVPSAALSGTGFSQGRSGAEFTTLGFSVEYLAVSNFTLPTAIASIATKVDGFARYFIANNDAEATFIKDSLFL